MPRYTRSEITRGLGPKFEAAVVGAAKKKVLRLADSIADEVVAEANKIIETEFVTDRDPLRRRKGTRHLAGSISVNAVTSEGGFPIKLVASSGAPKAKVNALEFGSRPHPIVARNAPFLVFPSVKGSAAERGLGGKSVFLEPTFSRPTSRARAAASAYQPIVKTKSVNHPGTKPYHFMQRALERVVRRRLR